MHQSKNTRRSLPSSLYLVLTLPIFMALFAILGCTPGDPHPHQPTSQPASASMGSATTPDTPTTEDLQLATFAGGCFWCVEAPFEKVPGVVEAVSGFSGGPEVNPTYKDVANGKTGHTEVVQVHFDATKVTYEKLLEVFWRQIDPTDAGGQFYDRGSQYRTEIFYHDEEQRKAAEASKKTLIESRRFKKVVTPITPFESFYAAEEGHQDYYEKSSDHYQRYRTASGRDRFIDEAWGNDRKVEFTRPVARYSKPSEETLRKKLSKTQYYVTQEDGTEYPFKNEYWDNKKKGIYVDVVSGEPLFSSKHKYKSGTGWPSFYQPLVKSNITEHKDYEIGYERVEVRSKHGDSHLGHVFKDGPKPTGLRYCINSASLRFIPAHQLSDEGYEQFVSEFED